jgi:hypothetical protein
MIDLADDTGKTTLAVTLAMETGLESHSGSIDEGYVVAARIDVLTDKTELGVVTHLRYVGTATDEVSDRHNDCIIGHCYFTSLSLFV